MTKAPLRLLARTGFYLLVAGILVYLLFPFYWALVSSLKPDGELFVTPVRYWPSALTLENYRLVIADGQFQTAFLNSILVSVGSVGLSLLVGAIAAYALGRIRFRGRNALQYVVLTMTMFPQIAVLGGLYTMINQFGLFNRLPALVFSYLLFTLPFTVWVLMHFFRTLPGELEEAAYMDGATPFRTFWQIMLPLSTPGLVTTGLLAFIQSWNEFLFALSLMQTPEHFTVTRAIFSFQGITSSSFEFPWGQVMAATILVTLPLIVLALIFQRRILAGLTAGAVKG